MYPVFRDPLENLEQRETADYPARTASEVLPDHRVNRDRPDQRDLQEVLDRMVKQDLRAPQVLLENPVLSVLTDLWAPRVSKERREPRDIMVVLDLLDCQETPARKVNPGFQDHRDLKGTEGTLDHEDLLDHLVRTVQPDFRVPKDQSAKRVNRDKTERQVSLDHKVHRDHRVSLDPCSPTQRS